MSQSPALIVVKKSLKRFSLASLQRDQDYHPVALWVDHQDIPEVKCIPVVYWLS